MMIARCVLVLGALAATACEAQPSSNPAGRQRGVLDRTSATAPQAPAEPTVHEFRAPGRSSSSTPGAGGTAPGRAQAATPDGGLLASDGGSAVTDDTALAAAVEAQGRTLAKCFPATMSTLPDVAIDFRISVSGIVTRTEVRAEGLDDAVSQCLTSTAEGIRFPTQSSVRAYRYPMKLRRTPRPDGGPGTAATKIE